MLTISFHNHKLNLLAEYLGLKKCEVICVDLPAGQTCHNADICKTFSNRITGKIIDNDKPNGIRCYAASVEGRYPSVRKSRWSNYSQLRNRSINEMVELIESSIPENVKVIRVHSSGDFFSWDYFLAWVRFSITHSDITIFGYSKMLACVKFLQDYPLPNFKLIYSWGGLMDKYVKNEPVCKIVKDKHGAGGVGLPLACNGNPSNDFDYIMRGESFALALHGNQKAKAK